MESPCFCSVLKAATRRVSAIYDAALEPVGVNIAQFSLLRRIVRAEPVTLTELGRMAELDRSTVGRNVRVLERMGLVALGRGEDQREATVTLTEGGRKVLREGGPLWDQAQNTVEARLGTGTTRDLRALLNEL